MADQPAELSLSVKAWLDRLAVKSPTPGGGSVAALAGALGSAVGLMALRYSQGRKANSPDDEFTISGAIDRFDKLAGVLRQLVVEDQIAYASWRAAKDAKDDAALAEAAVACLAVPAAVMAAGVSLLVESVAIEPKCNPWLRSDLLVAGELATATVRCARHNVLANAGDDEARLGDVAEADRLLERAVDLVRQLTQ